MDFILDIALHECEVFFQLGLILPQKSVLK